MCEKTLVCNPVTAYSDNTSYIQICERDCPIIIEGKTVRLNPQKMILNHQYHFDYLGEKLMAVKVSDTEIEIYEVLEERK